MCFYKKSDTLAQNDLLDQRRIVSYNYSKQNVVKKFEGTMSIMKKSICLILCILLICCFCLPVSAAGDITNEELNTYIQNEFEKTNIPAMSVEIVDAENVLFSQQYGNGANADTPFILGSISKSFTALAISQLVEQGKIDVTKPFCTYLPEVNQESKTTVKQLLNHTSGIHTNMTMEDYKTSDTVQNYEYANVNYNLLGLIVEHISGMSYGEYIKANIFEPLGMTHSYTSIEEAKANGLIDGHRNYFGLMIANECAYPENMTSGWMTLSAAYLISTANDMGKYLQFYLGGNTRILSDESIYKMFHDTTKITDDYEYGYGWGISKAPDVTMYQHGGNVENYTTYMIMLPQLGKAVVVLTNAGDYFSADDMVVNLSTIIALKLSGIETVNLDGGAYMTTHIVLDAIMLIIVAAGILSLVFLKKSFKNRKISAIRLIGFVILHLVLPTVLLLVPNMLDTTLWISARFAPDVFAVLVFGSSALYLSGICKIIFYFRHFKKPTVSNQPASESKT